MKKLFNNTKIVLTIIGTGLCFAVLLFVIGLILDMSGTIDLESDIKQIEISAAEHISEVENGIMESVKEAKHKDLEKRLEKQRIKKLDEEYNKRLDELNDWYLSQR